MLSAACSGVLQVCGLHDAHRIFELGDSGRVLLRPSGTESLVRVMVEAESYEAANGVAHRLADVVKASLAL